MKIKERKTKLLGTRITPSLKSEIKSYLLPGETQSRFLIRAVKAQIKRRKKQGLFETEKQ